MKEPAAAASTSIVLVVPCFDEADRLPLDAFEAGLAAAPGLRLHLVDDGSRDATRATLEALAERAPGRISVTALAQNQGKAEAVRQGMRAALAAPGEAVWIGYWDADLATPLDAAHRMVALGGADEATELVMGSRVRLLGRQIERRPLRHYAGRIVAVLTARTLRLPVYDTQCGAKLFRVTPGLAELFEAPFISRWLFDVELLARMQRRAARGAGRDPRHSVVEMPLDTWRHVPGSKVRPADFARSLLDLHRIRRAFPWRDRRVD